MKLVTYGNEGNQKLGAILDGDVVDLCAAAAQLKKTLPATMLGFIEAGAPALDIARDALRAARDNKSLREPLAGTRLCAPIPQMRKNVFCVGRNYKAHIEEGARAQGRQVVFPTVPEFFSKPPTTVIGHGDDIQLDTGATKQLDYEVELGIVVGTKVRNLTEQNALGSVFGYTVINDVSARDAQRAHGQWFKGKSMDTFCPIGPWIVTADEFGKPSGHRLTTRVNGGTRQDSNTSDMLFSCEQILASLSCGLTLHPGDMIATGTPSGVALGMTPQIWLKNGDLVETEVEGIGVLQNRVRQIA